MESFLLNGRIIPWEQLESVAPGTPFEQETLSFLKEWKAGRPSFKIQTSGSTGSPKSIEISRDLMRQSAERTNRYLHLDRRDHALVCMNTAYIAGKMMLVRALVADMTLSIIDPSSTPLAGLTVRPTFTAMVPLQLETVLNTNASALGSFRAILVGGAPVSAALRQQAAHLDTPVFETYGMTETLTHIALKKISGPVPERHFTVLPGIEIKRNPEGCLEIRGDVTRNQWLTTTDMVELRGDEGFVWLGRKDFVINSGGVKIHPEQVEAQIEFYFREKGWTNRFVVVPFPDERLGEMVTLVIEGKLPVPDTTVLEELRYLADGYARPRKILHLDLLPETESGKIDRLSTLRHWQ